MPTPTPLMLRSLGRSGSTALMQLLATSANVLFPRSYPFEIRLLSYTVRVAELVRQQPHNGADWNHAAVMRKDPTRVGPPPYRKLNGLDRERFFRAFAAAAVRGMLGALDTSAADTQHPVYYAEKAAPNICPLVMELLPDAKIIFLLRDPRDEFVSTRAFNARRERFGLGWQPGESEVDFARRIIKGRRRILREFAALRPDDHTFKLRYEDLISRGAEIAHELSDWLGTVVSWTQVQSQQARYSHHITSGSPAQSVGRYATELEPELLKIFRDGLAEELAANDYEP